MLGCLGNILLIVVERVCTKKCVTLCCVQVCHAYLCVWIVDGVVVDDTLSDFSIFKGLSISFSLSNRRISRHKIMWSLKPAGPFTRTETRPASRGMYVFTHQPWLACDCSSGLLLIRYKLMKWWAQSFLVGVPKIVCGFRDDDGIIQHLQTFRTIDIPKESQVHLVKIS